jgi:hypothetical protein
MPRNANRSVPISWIISLIAVVVLAGGGIYFLRSFLSDPYRGIPDLPVAEYVDNSLSFRGNTYKVIGRVENQVGWSDTAGRLFSFESEPDGKQFHLAILLPAGLNDVNVQKGQDFEIKVKVVDKGMLEAVQIRKA